MFRFIFSYLKNKEESEEVFHEAFIRVLKSSNTAKFDQGTFKGWIYQVARNLCLNRLRSHKRGAEALLNLESEPVQASSETEFLEKDFAEKVIFTAEKLPKLMLELFNMRRMGMAYQDISQILGVPLGTVKSRIHTLVETLKLELKL